MKSTISHKHNSSPRELGAWIKNLRHERKLTQRQLADQAGVSFSFINQVEGGKQTVRLDTLNKLIGVFGYQMAPTRTKSNET